MGYTKKAVKYVGDGIPHVDCECGHAINLYLPVIKGLPMTYVCGNCGIEYDSRGWILSRHETFPAGPFPGAHDFTKPKGE